MSTNARQALLLGTVVTLLVVAAQALGWLDGLERLTIDLRFQHARWRHEPLSPVIRHVDIDDGAIDTFGSWPWPRSYLADAIDELRLAGARTIVLDILLSDEKKGSDQESDELKADAAMQDASLAAALSRTNCVLPVQLADKVMFDDDWHTPRGRPELNRLLNVLKRDIRIDARVAADQAQLTYPRRERFRGRPLAFKEVAAWQTLQQLRFGDDGVVRDVAFDELLRTVAPGVDERTGSFAELDRLRLVWSQQRSWSALDAFLLDPLPTQNPAGRPEDRAPLERFAVTADGVGFVNPRTDRDGAVRQVAPLLPAPGGRALQLGLAAALAHNGLALNEVHVTDDTLVIGSVRLPLDDGLLWLRWPTTETDWSGMSRKTGDESGTAGRTSIGALVSVAAERRKLARLRDEWDAVTAEVSAKVFDEPYSSLAAMPPEKLADLRDEVAFRVQDAEQAGDQEALAPEELAEIAPYQHWAMLEEAVTNGQRALERAAAHLKGELNDALVFVGWTATGAVADFVSTPLGARTPGVVVHTVAADMALTGRAVRMAPPWIAPVFGVLMGLLFALLAARLQPLVGAGVAAVLLLGYLGLAGWWLFGARTFVMPLTGPMFAAAGSWTACTALVAALFQRDRSRITRQFKSRVSPELVDFLVDHPQSLSMAGEERDVTIMFLDLAGFTAMTEKLNGPQIVAVLNRTLAALTTEITRHGGYVNKFLGDGLMAFWSAFAPDPRQALHAVKAALACREVMASLNAERTADGTPPLAVRIGIATAGVIVGDCGAPPLLNDYTVIGDGVNLASRLESANKQFGTSIIMDGATAEAVAAATRDAGATAFAMRPIGRFIVVGQSRPVEVTELLPPDADAEMIRLSAETARAFQAGNAAECRQAVESLMQRFGASKLGEVYLAALADATLTAEGGAIRLREK